MMASSPNGGQVEARSPPLLNCLFSRVFATCRPSHAPSSSHAVFWNLFCYNPERQLRMISGYHVSYPKIISQKYALLKPSGFHRRRSWGLRQSCLRPRRSGIPNNTIIARRLVKNTWNWGSRGRSLCVASPLGERGGHSHN